MSERVCIFAAENNNKTTTDMKTKRPTIKIILAKDKAKDGKAPAFIQVNWRGRAKESTGKWLRTPEEARSVAAIRNRMAEIEERVDMLLASGQPFTAAQCLMSQSRPGMTLTKIASELCHQRRLSDSTTHQYIVAVKHWEEYFGDIHFASVSQSMVKGAAKVWLREAATGTVWARLSVLKSLFTFAVERGYCKANPFDKWNFKGDGYRPPKEPKARTREEVMMIKEAWIEGNEGAGWWYACYRFNGLALVDLLKLDLDNIVELNGYLTWTVNRQKTNGKANIIVKDDYDTRQLIKFMREQRFGTDRKTRLKNFQDRIRRDLAKLPFSPKLTYYQARHTFATELVNKNVSLNDLAQLLGRSVDNISVYIKQIGTVDHLIGVMERAGI